MRYRSEAEPVMQVICHCKTCLKNSGSALAFIKAGTLDDATWLTPTVHIWGAEKLPWVQIPEGATQVPGNPT